MFNKQDYIKSKSWELDSSLLNPDTATKSCAFCHDKKYTVEFADVPEFEDGKLPVCTQCLRSLRILRNGVKPTDVIDGREKRRKCVTCDTVKQITAFSYHKSRNNLSNKCKECTGTWWGKK